MTQHQYSRSTKFRALRGITYTGTNGELIHAKEGDIVTDYPPSGAKLDVRDGVLEHYEVKRKEAEE